MKNILGTQENLKLYNEQGNNVYEYYKDSNGYSLEYTRDSNGNALTCKDLDGVTQGFDIPEFTMEQLVAKIGNFKLKK